MGGIRYRTRGRAGGTGYEGVSDGTGGWNLDWMGDLQFLESCERRVIRTRSGIDDETKVVCRVKSVGFL